MHNIVTKHEQNLENPILLKMIGPNKNSSSNNNQNFHQNPNMHPGMMHAGMMHPNQMKGMPHGMHMGKNFQGGKSAAF